MRLNGGQEKREGLGDGRVRIRLDRTPELPKNGVSDVGICNIFLVVGFLT